MREWYLLRTKVGGERRTQEQLRHLVEETLLPLGKMPVRQRDRTFDRISPIFPCYLFARFSLEHNARRIRYTPGLRDIVKFGERAAVVPGWVINELNARCAQGPIEFAEPGFSRGSAVKVVDGPFRQFEAIFDGYLTGSERIAVLLSIMNAERRIVMPRNMVMAAE
jgi:transcriptional antiterminator RfaH